MPEQSKEPERLRKLIDIYSSSLERQRWHTTSLEAAYKEKTATLEARLALAEKVVEKARESNAMWNHYGLREVIKAYDKAKETDA